MVASLLAALVLHAASPQDRPVARTATDPAIGKWKVVPSNGIPERWWYWTLEILPDGTFRQHRDLRVMMNILGDGTGTWRREGVGIQLKGAATESVDDGYAKETGTNPINDLLREKSGKLVLTLGTPGTKGDATLEIVFRRVATLDREPEPPSPPPDRKAIALWALTRKAYGNMSVYAASGETFDPNGKKGQASGRFSLRFARSTGLTLRATSVVLMKSDDSVLIQAGSNASTISERLGPKPSKGGRWDAFDSLERITGYDFGLFAELLLNRSPAPSSRYTEIRLLRTKTVDGRVCDELSLKGVQGQLWIVSVSRKTHLIVAIRSEGSDFRLYVRNPTKPSPIRRR